MVPESCLGYMHTISDCVKVIDEQAADEKDSKILLDWQLAKISEQLYRTVAFHKKI